MLFRSHREIKLKRIQEQIAHCTIHAPQSGMVVYPRNRWRHSSQSMIEPGATVRERQVIVELPDTSSMKVVVKIHEANVEQVKLGQPAYIRIDALPDQQFRGRVRQVAVMPDAQNRWLNPDLKVYRTEIVIDDDLPSSIKPGLSARAEIIVTRLEDVVHVPIQAVVTQDQKQFCYKREDRGLVRVPVRVGLYNKNRIQILSGLDAGDRILLDPPSPSDIEHLGLKVIDAGDITDEDEAAADKAATAPKPAAARPSRAPDADGRRTGKGPRGGKGAPGHGQQ